MRIPRQTSTESPAVPMTTFTDLVFTLLIFFMVTTTFREEERDIQVNLPEDTQAQTLSAADKLIVINVRKTGVYLVRDRQLTVEELAKAIKAEIAEDPNRKVLVRADQEALHGYVAQAIATCKHVGVNEANIGYEVAR
jgi:biopolymer transport protein ExbD